MVLVLVNSMAQWDYLLSICVFLPQHVGFCGRFLFKVQDSSGRCTHHMKTWPRWSLQKESVHRLLPMTLGNLYHTLFHNLITSRRGWGDQHWARLMGWIPLELEVCSLHTWLGRAGKWNRVLLAKKNGRYWQVCIKFPSRLTCGLPFSLWCKVLSYSIYSTVCKCLRSFFLNKVQA